MGCDSQYGGLSNFLPTWYGGRCLDCFRDDYGFHRDWDIGKSRPKNMPQSVKLSKKVEPYVRYDI
jgi:hypothetical protein